jgi:hypothetical protein
MRAPMSEFYPNRRHGALQGGHDLLKRKYSDILQKPENAFKPSLDELGHDASKL